MRLKFVYLLAVCGTLSAPVLADQVTWDFRSGQATSSPHVASGPAGFGNIRTFTHSASGLTVTVTAWGLTGSGMTTFQTAQSGRWSTGLGICNQTEGANCSGPDLHQVDDSGQLDFMLFQFSTLVDPLNIKIDPYNAWDRDVSYYVGTAANPLNLTGDTLADLVSVHNLTGPTHSDDVVSDAIRTVNLNSGLVNTVLFGARFSSSGYTADGYIDRFKIKSLTADYNAVPEPATTAMTMVLIAGLITGLVRRRQTKSSR